eukprot:3285529-Amphidinium_carterae.2
MAETRRGVCATWMCARFYQNVNAYFNNLRVTVERSKMRMRTLTRMAMRMQTTKMRTSRSSCLALCPSRESFLPFSVVGCFGRQNHWSLCSPYCALP